MLAVSLSDFERCEFSIFLLVFSCDFVQSFSLEPVFAPLFKIKRLKWLEGIVAKLECINEIGKGRVSPFMSLEINIETVAESFPPHQED
jgi:hypothetical protein